MPGQVHMDSNANSDGTRGSALGLPRAPLRTRWVNATPGRASSAGPVPTQRDLTSSGGDPSLALLLMTLLLRWARAGSCCSCHGRVPSPYAPAVATGYHKDVRRTRHMLGTKSFHSRPLS